MTEPEPRNAGGVAAIATASPVSASCRDAGPRWWANGALAAGREALREGPVAAVFTSMSPYESAPVAAQLAAEAGVPWIADLRDPWALDEMVVYSSSLHRRRAMARMGRELASAGAVVMNTEGAASAATAAFPHLRRVTAIPNGFDPDDFLGPSPLPAERRRAPHRAHRLPPHGARPCSIATRRAPWRGGEREPVDILPAQPRVPARGDRRTGRLPSVARSSCTSQGPSPARTRT